MSSALLQYPLFQAFDDNGDPLSGGLLYTYVAGTSTNKATYADKDLVSANTNPVVLDARGEAQIYFTGQIKLVLKDSAGSTIWTEDYIEGVIQSHGLYFADASESDQGAAGDGNTIKDLVDAIGAKSATIILTHSGTGNTTTYTLDTAETTPANIYLKIEPGAIIQPAVGISLTVYSPEHILASPRQQIIDSTNNSTDPLAFTVNGTVYPDWFYSGTGSWHTAIGLADGCSKLVQFLAHEYAITTGVVQAASHVWQGAGLHGTKISISGAIVGITFGPYGQVNDLRVNGDDTVGQVGIVNAENAGEWSLSRIRIRSCDVGLELSETWIGSIIKAEISNNVTGVKITARYASPRINAVQFFGGSIYSNSETGILINATSGNVNNLALFGVVIENNTNYGIYQEVGTVTALQCRACWIEGNGIGAQFDVSTNHVTFDTNRFYLTNDADSHAIVFSAGFHSGTRIIGNDIDRSGTGATVAIEFNATQNRPAVHHNTIDSNLSITDSSTLSMSYINSSGGVYLPGVTSISGGTQVTGNNFAGKVTLSNPNTTAAVSFSTNEPDTNYGVYVAAPGWAAGHIWVTDKAVGGFTINVETTKPSGSESLFWIIIRR